MAKDKVIYYTLNKCNAKQIFIGDDTYLSFVGSRIVYLDDGNFNDVLCVPSLSCNIILAYQIPHLGEGKTIEFSPHQVVIKDLKDPKHVLAIGIVNDITKLYRFDNFGASSSPLVFISHGDDLRKIWHDNFGHLNIVKYSSSCFLERWCFC
jgi:hypothetical protein